MKPFAPGGQSHRQRQEAERQTPLARLASIPVTNVTNTNVTLFTVPDNRFFALRLLGVANIAGSNLAVTVHVVPSGGSASNSNKVYDAFVVWPNTSEVLWAVAGEEAHHLLEPGDQIVAVTDSATGGNFYGWGHVIEGER